MDFILYEKIELDDEERIVFAKVQDLLHTIATGTTDLTLKAESEELARKIRSFYSRNIIAETARYDDPIDRKINESTPRESSEYDRGFHDGVEWQENNPPIRSNY